MSRFGKGDLVGTRQVESERLGALHQFAQVRVPPEQILDKLPSDGLLPTHPLATSLGVTLGESRDGVVHDMQHRGGRRPYRIAIAFQDDGGQLAPHPPRRGQVQVDSLTGRDSLLGSAPALPSYRVDLATSREPPDGGCLGEHGQVFA